MSQPTCILCPVYHPHADPHAPEPGWYCCLAGHRRLELELLGLRAAFRRLSEEVRVEAGARDAVSQQLPGAPTPSPSNQPVVSGSRDRKLPIDTTKVDLILPAVPGYVHDLNRDQTGSYSVASMLNEWVATWHDRWASQERYPRTDAVSLIDWILTPRLQLVIQHEQALADFAGELRKLRGLLGQALGERTPKRAVMWGIECPRCKLVSQLSLDPEDPDQFRECGNCGLLLSRDGYLQHLRDLVDRHRTREQVADG